MTFKRLKLELLFWFITSRYWRWLVLIFMTENARLHCVRESFLELLDCYRNEGDDDDDDD